MTGVLIGPEEDPDTERRRWVMTGREQSGAAASRASAGIATSRPKPGERRVPICPRGLQREHGPLTP